MAWIETHQSLPTHRKTKALRRVLKINTVRAVGTLVMLWLWALDSVPVDGNLEGIDPRDLAEAAGWTGDVDHFLEALIDAGFVDRGPPLQLHDWLQYGGAFAEVQKQKREQKAAGGRARMAQLSPEDRSRFSKQAAEKRWNSENEEMSSREMPAEMPADGKSMPGTVPTVPTRQDNTNEEREAPAPKKRCGQFNNVLLTEDELRKLDERFGEHAAKDKVEALSEKIASHGGKYEDYKSHYAVILAWDRSDRSDGNNGHRPAGQRPGNARHLRPRDSYTRPEEWRNNPRPVRPHNAYSPPYPTDDEAQP